jgi:cytochrome b subunit of formate dehydrogenase
VAVSFLLTALSGVYFLFVPGGNWSPDPQFLFTRTTWDMIHTWASVALIVAAVLHFTIHWNWVTKVTGKMLDRVISSRPGTIRTIKAGSELSQ